LINSNLDWTILLRVRVIRNSRHVNYHVQFSSIWHGLKDVCLLLRIFL